MGLICVSFKFTFAFLGFLTCAGFANANPTSTVRKVDETTLRLEGPIFSPMLEQLKTVLSPKISTFEVDSEGGDTATAIEIAEIMMSRKIDLIVDGICASSCANYLFVAAEKKTVNKGSVVGWHGGYSNAASVIKEDLSDILRRHALLKREQLLYLKKGVSIELIVYSAYLTNYKIVNDASGRKIKQREFDLWVPNKKTLESLGVKHLDMQSNFANAADVEAALAKHGAVDQKVFTGALHAYLPIFYKD